MSEPLFSFDFSKSHHVVDVGWPSTKTGEVFTHDESFSSLTLRLSGNRVFQERLAALIVERRGDSVVAIRAHMCDMKLDNVYVEAKRLIAAWHFDEHDFSAWYEKTKKGEADDTFATMRNDLEPNLVLKVLHSFNDQEPWFISFEVEW